mgnify:CR=1 FL=1
MPMNKSFSNLRQQGQRYYFDHGGKPRRWEPLGKDFAKVMARYHEIVGGQQANGSTVCSLIDKHLAKLSGKSPATVKNYRNCAKIIKPIFGHLAPHQVEQWHITRFIEESTRKMMARNAALYLKLSLSWGVAHGYVKHSKLVGMRLEGQNRRKRYLTDGEFLTIRNALRGPFQIAADLAYLLSLRVSGAVMLKFSDVKDGVISFHPPKSKNPISFTVTQEVQEVLDRAKRQDGAGSLYVVHSRVGQPYSKHTISLSFAKAAKAVGIENVRFHDIRAKSASDDAPTATKRLGHTDERTTAGYLRKPEVITPIGKVK